ncbi:hypothetical protein BURPS1106B_A2714 [Burkholderia pseudomallei 1106b]|nr:hypothetical protein BPC006_I3546 [Burkholderia pseudomallei BPC006]EEH27151.1 hypothetical protein BUH_3565 [Burkholderia pseudomallei Pakistan 9]EES24728.1 hypothetical protein BURPS1106B_A2714 [Burkholderia pseudomallei 1106b]
MPDSRAPDARSGARHVCTLYTTRGVDGFRSEARRAKV